MIGRKNMDLVERILTALNEGPEVEDYAIDEIEAVPIEIVNARLQELGVDPTVPPAIMNFVRRGDTPAQRVIDALSEHDSEEDEIERLDLNKVHAALHDAGLNYRAGVERIRHLTGASDHSEEPKSPTPLGQEASGGVVTFSTPIVARASHTDTIITEVSDKWRGFHQPAKPKRVLSCKVVLVTLAAVAASACLFIVDKNALSLKIETAALRSKVVAMKSLEDDHALGLAENLVVSQLSLLSAKPADTSDRDFAFLLGRPFDIGFDQVDQRAALDEQALRFELAGQLGKQSLGQVSSDQGQTKPAHCLAISLVVEGKPAQVQSASTGVSGPAALNEQLCPGDVLRVGERSRVEVTVVNQPDVRLDQNTALSLAGDAYFLSRHPRGLTMSAVTPNLNLQADVRAEYEQ